MAVRADSQEGSVVELLHRLTVEVLAQEFNRNLFGTSQSNGVS